MSGSDRAIAYFLAMFAAFALAGILPAAVLAARAGGRALAVFAAAVGLFAATVLASGAAALW